MSSKTSKSMNESTFFNCFQLLVNVVLLVKKRFLHFSNFNFMRFKATKISKSDRSRYASNSKVKEGNTSKSSAYIEIWLIIERR